LASERDYSHRRVVDKLGIKPSHAVALDTGAGPLDAGLETAILEQTGRPLAEYDELVDVALVTVKEAIDPVAMLERWKPRMQPDGGIWLLTPKRGRPGYVNQDSLIPAGRAAGLVDNKICSVSETTSAMRFVLRKEDRKR
jgi:hypothetical protein